MRSLHKSWQDKRPGWTRRVRWYEGSNYEEEISIRLQFTDEERMSNFFYTDPEAAQTDYDLFRLEGKSVADLLQAHGRTEV